MAKKKTQGWLDAYDDELQLGGYVYPVNYVPQAENGIEGTMGGLTDQGFDYNGAWGGPSMQNGGLTFLEPTSRKLPKGHVIPKIDPSTELATSIGGVGDEPAYLIPSFKYGRLLNDPEGEFIKTGEHLGGPFKTWQEADEWERTVRHPYVEKGQNIPTPFRRWGKDFAMGGSLPGSVGFTYARTGGIPSNGPYAKKTKASAQNGMEMKFYQEGLDWKPRNISKDGSEVPKAQPGKKITFEDLVKSTKKRAASDNTNSGIKSKVKNQIGAQEASNQKAEQKVQTLVDKGGYSEAHARRAVKNKEEKANSILEKVSNDDYRIQMHPDFDPNKSTDEQSYLLNDNSLRTRLLRGSNMLMNAGNPVGDFATGMITAPARSFANLTMDANNRYFNPNNTGAGNSANFAEDVINIFPSIIPGAAGALGQASSAVSKGTRAAGRFLTEETALKNAYKINPWRFKANPEAYYHRSPNLKNVINQEKNIIQGFGASEEGKLYNESFGFRPGSGIRLTKSADSEMYFSKGTPLDWGRTNMVLDKKTGKLIPGQGYPGPYIVEVENVPFVAKANRKFTKVLDPKTGEYVIGELPPTARGSYAVPKRPVSLNEGKFYKEHWLKGYKEVKPLKKKEKGGKIKKDDMGYWNPDNWGKPVEIGSNEITMEGVYEPLIGISDTGDTQLMFPGEDYKFDGESVTEYPVTNWLDKYN